MSILRVLPDPDVLINAAGQEDPGGVAGPGFVSLSVGSEFRVGREDSIGGRSTLKTKQRPRWTFTLKYNPLTAQQFSPVYNFLMEKRGSREAFYVSMPQYSYPKDPLFKTFVESNTPTNVANVLPGQTSMEITDPSWVANTYSGVPKVGDVFTVSDFFDSTHANAYMVTRVETFTDYEVQPSTGNITIHFTPPMARELADTSDIIFHNPLFRVRQRGDIQQYSLDTENLYEFSVQLEEAL